jgi:hypothetical protein
MKKEYLKRKTTRLECKEQVLLRNMSYSNNIRQFSSLFNNFPVSF